MKHNGISSVKIVSPCLGTKGKISVLRNLFSTCEMEEVHEIQGGGSFEKQ